MIKLGVNVDHVATLRQARLARYPDPVEASLAAERAGANAMTVHLREDRQHIQDTDLFGIHQAIQIHLNQEMAPIPEMLEIAMELRPDEVCLVPERREELTTEGGLDAAGLKYRLLPILERLSLARIGISLFVDPEPRQIEAAVMLGADFVEIHTGTYANLADADWRRRARTMRGTGISARCRAPCPASNRAWHTGLTRSFPLSSATRRARNCKRFALHRCYSRNRLATYRPCYCRLFLDSWHGARRTRNAQIDQRLDQGGESTVIVSEPRTTSRQS